MAYKKRRSGKSKKQKFSAAERKAYYIGMGAGYADKPAGPDFYKWNKSNAVQSSFNRGYNEGRSRVKEL